MSSDLFLLDGPLFRHSPELPDLDLQDLSDALYLEPPAFDIFEALNEDLDPNTNQFSDRSSVSLSTSPPSLKMHTLSLAASDAQKSLVLNDLDASIQVSLSSLVPGGIKQENINVPQFLDRMQRSLSSHSLDNPQNGGSFQPHFSSFSEVPGQFTDLHGGFGFSGGSMRRVCSTGDLPQINRMQTNQRAASPLASSEMLSSSFDESGFKVGRYSAEQRKQSIHRYRSKRTQRNFNKKIKYACRKTLADSRPRIRGRFARNEEIGEIPKAPDDYDEEVDGFDEEEFVMGHKHSGFNSGRYIGCAVTICPKYQYFGC